MKKLLPILALLVVALLAGTAFGVRYPYMFVPPGTGFVKVTSGSQASTAAAISLTSTAEVTGNLTPARGGTGQDLSASTGVLKVSSGTVSAGTVNLASTADVTGSVTWANALDCDLTAEASQTLSSNTTYTFCGKTWTKFNSASDSTAMALTSGSGLVIVPISSTDYANATRTIPGVYLPLSSLFTLVDGMRIRANVYISAFNGAANYDAVNFGFDSQSTTSGYMSARGYATTGIGINNFIQVNSTNQGSQLYAVAMSSANNCVQIEVPRFGEPMSIVRVGQYSSGWPTVWTHGRNYVGSGVDLSSFVLSNMSLVIGAKRAGSGTALSATIARVRVDYMY